MYSWSEGCQVGEGHLGMVQGTKDRKEREDSSQVPGSAAGS